MFECPDCTNNKVSNVCQLVQNFLVCAGEEFKILSRVEGKMSRVESKMSRVEGKMSRVQFFA